MRAGAKEIKERTEGRVQIKFYGGGVMGNDQKVLSRIRIGSLFRAVRLLQAALANQYPGLDICMACRWCSTRRRKRPMCGLAWIASCAAGLEEAGYR